MIFATAGHVDHGKTSLVKALTGVDTDRLEEEKARGLTIDLGFAYCHQNDQTIGFVDVPGHSRFISNMLAGVSAIDHALLIIAADDGPMPQTHEHLSILELLGISELTVVVTKIDRVSDEHLQRTRQAVNDLLATTRFNERPLFEVSSVSGTGISHLSEHLWTLQRLKNRSSDQYFRLAVDRRFTVKGSGIVVTGSVFSGQVSQNEELWLMPGKHKVRVRGLHRQDREAQQALEGDRSALNLTGNLSLEQVKRGQWVTNHPRLPLSQRLDVELSLLPSETPLKTGTPVHIHSAAQHTTGRVFLLEQRQLAPGDTALAQLVMADEISACSQDRMILRDQNATRTLAGARVLDAFSVRRGRSKPARLDYLHQLAEQHSPASIESLLKKTTSGLHLERFFDGQNLPLPKQHFLTDSKGYAYHPDQVKALTTLALKQINEAPMTRESLRSQLDIREPLLVLILKSLQETRAIKLEGSEFHPADKPSELPQPVQKLLDKVRPILTAAELQPPVLHELSKQVGLPPAAVEKLLDSATRQGELVRPVKNRFFLPETLRQVRQLAIECAEQHDGEFTVIQFRDHSGMGRNLCIELLEFLDGKGFTRRTGDKRIIQDTNR